MTMREWLMEREKRGERLLLYRGHPEWGITLAGEWLAEFGGMRPYADELDKSGATSEICACSTKGRVSAMNGVIAANMAVAFAVWAFAFGGIVILTQSPFQPHTTRKEFVVYSIIGAFLLATLLICAYFAPDPALHF